MAFSQEKNKSFSVDVSLSLPQQYKLSYLRRFFFYLNTFIFDTKVMRDNHFSSLVSVCHGILLKLSWKRFKRVSFLTLCRLNCRILHCLEEEEGYK